MDSVSSGFYEDVGNRIRFFRMRKRFTVEELSKMAEISNKYMYQIEGGKVSFSTEILYKIARALGVPSDALLMEKGMDIGNIILSEVAGKFTIEEKEYIKRVILRGLAEEM